jgi:hypothetical protein
MNILCEQDVINLNNHWYLNEHEWLGKKHKTNNPSGYVLEPLYKDPTLTIKYRDIRLGHLNQLLQLIYENFIVHGDKLVLTPIEHKRFHRYIYTEIIHNFPYKCFKDLKKEEICAENEQTDYDNWIEDILTYKTETKTGRNKYNNDISFLKLRREIILQHFVSEIAHFINKLQVEDINNSLDSNMLVDNKKLVYGEKHALSAFLGQHIIRMFPFKEELKFRSIAAKALPKSGKCIYEHWTPISFFRDLIWINQPETVKPKVFSSDEWYKILKYAYRTILITKDEDDKLNSNKFKSKRLFSTYKLNEINIEVSDTSLWEELHRI